MPPGRLLRPQQRTPRRSALPSSSRPARRRHLPGLAGVLGLYHRRHYLAGSPCSPPGDRRRGRPSSFEGASPAGRALKARAAHRARAGPASPPMACRAAATAHASPASRTYRPPHHRRGHRRQASTSPAAAEGPGDQMVAARRRSRSPARPAGDRGRPRRPEPTLGQIRLPTTPAAATVADACSMRHQPAVRATAYTRHRGRTREFAELADGSAAPPIQPRACRRQPRSPRSPAARRQLADRGRHRAHPPPRGNTFAGGGLVLRQRRRRPSRRPEPARRPPPPAEPGPGVRIEVSSAASTSAARRSPPTIAAAVASCSAVNSRPEGDFAEPSDRRAGAPRRVGGGTAGLEQRRHLLRSSRRRRPARRRARSAADQSRASGYGPASRTPTAPADLGWKAGRGRGEGHVQVRILA